MISLTTTRGSISIFALAIAACLFSSHVRAEEPAIRRENIEWTNIWIPDATKTDLPRVLLVGDSICNAYYDHVAQTLKGKAYVAKLATASAVGDPVLDAQIKMLLANYKFSVVHFNNGLHGFDNSEEYYKAEFPKLVEMIKQTSPDAKLLWATSTPMRNSSNLQQFHELNGRVQTRNRIVVELAAKFQIPVVDLYSVVENHPDYWSNDGVHFKGEGQGAEAAEVTKAILGVLK